MALEKRTSAQFDQAAASVKKTVLIGNLSNIKNLSSDMNEAIEQLGPIVSNLKENVDSLSGAIRHIRTE